MTRASDSHLSPDEIDACLSGVLPLEAQAHLDVCQTCREQVQADREIAQQIAALPLFGPTEGFDQRVMASVLIPDPFAIRSLQAAGRRLFATPRSFAAAAVLTLVVVGSMVGSVAWSLANQDTLAAFGSWLFAQAGQAAWLGMQGLASNFIEQPWYAALKSMAEQPGRLALISGLGSLVYLGGLIALRRLLAVPTQRVAHVGL